jgi:hypothetical protein
MTAGMMLGHMLEEMTAPAAPPTPAGRAVHAMFVMTAMVKTKSHSKILC